MRLFFDLLDLCVHNSSIVYNKIVSKQEEPFTMNALDFRGQLSTQLINSFSNRQREVSSAQIATIKRSKASEPINLSGHYLTKIPDGKRKRCSFCNQYGRENRTAVMCSESHS